MICGSIRNFLKICEFLWPEIKKQLTTSTTISIINSTLQSKAIKKCAEHVFNGVDNKDIAGAIPVSYQDICERFADIFKRFISKDSLKITTECLSLKIPSKDLDDFFNDLINSIVLYEAFIKIEDNNDFLIGLHPIISPKFNLPYRSPFYYYQSISLTDFKKVILSKSKSEFEQIAKEIYAKRVNEKTYPLFE